MAFVPYDYQGPLSPDQQRLPAFDAPIENVGVGQVAPESQVTTPGFRMAVGTAVENLGGYLGLPETGISEWIAGGPTPQTKGVAYASDGFDMSLYPGWGETEARADFKATGGPSGGGGGGSWGPEPVPEPVTYQNPY